MSARSSGSMSPWHATLALLAVMTTVTSLGAQPARTGTPRSAVDRMQEPGPEAQELARRSGTWSVVMTIRANPDATPVVTTGMIAERRMVGTFLEEVMKPAPGSNLPDFRRIAYLTYSRVEGRWQYVSLDTRFPTGIMPAWSFERERDGTLTLQFESLGFVGFGSEVEGRLMRSNLVITRTSADRERAQQFWVQADGSGRQWLAVQYEYARQR